MSLSLLDETQLRRLLSDIGGVPPGEYALNYIQQSFVGDGVSNAFTLSHAANLTFPAFVYSSTGVLVTVNPFTIVGTTITFQAIPGLGYAFYVLYYY